MGAVFIVGVLKSGIRMPVPTKQSEMLFNTLFDALRLTDVTGIRRLVDDLVNPNNVLSVWH